MKWKDSKRPAPATEPREVQRRLAGKVLALALLPIILAVGVSTALVESQVSRLVKQEVDAQLSIARSLAIDLLEAREDDLRAQGDVVARDPKFFAMLAPTGLERDDSFRRTLEDIASQFATTLGSDQLEIVDENGLVQASWESRATRGVSVGALPLDASKEPDIALALDGQAARAVRWGLGGHLVQTVAIPVIAGGRLVGVLRHGDRIDTELIGRIRNLTRCDVAFVADGKMAETTVLDFDFPHTKTTAEVGDWLGDADLQLVLYRSTEPEKQFMARLRWLLVLIGLGGVACGVFFARSLVRRITGPVDRLVNAAIRLERGESDEVIAIDTGDELEYLGRRFDEMRSALRSQIRALEDLDRMKSMFLTVASHELRTPATIIQGNVELLDYVKVADDDAYPQIVDGLKRGVARLQDVLQRIGDMALVDSEDIRLAMRPLSTGDLVSQLSQSFRKMRKGRELKFEAPEGEHVWIVADPTRLGQAIGNLLHNAIRFTPDGGTVRLIVEAEGVEEAEVSPGLMRKVRRGRSNVSLPGGAKTVRLIVEDTGVGVDEEHQEKIFEAFYEARDVLLHSSGSEGFESGGLGLGLAITRSIVDAHGGLLYYEPAELAGSRFVIELPGLTYGLNGHHGEEADREAA